MTWTQRYTQIYPINHNGDKDIILKLCETFIVYWMDYDRVRGEVRRIINVDDMKIGELYSAIECGDAFFYIEEVVNDEHRSNEASGNDVLSLNKLAKSSNKDDAESSDSNIQEDAT